LGDSFLFYPLVLKQASHLRPATLRKKKETGREWYWTRKEQRDEKIGGKCQVLASLILIPLLGKPRSIRGNSQRANCRRGSMSSVFRWAATEGPPRLA
jgi:hypothetical protein